MTEQVPDLYDELGVPRDASAQALRAGYRRRARQLHPDVAGPDVAGRATTGDAMRRLNKAWEVLGDPERRRRYDQSLAGASGGHDWAEASTPTVAPETVEPELVDAANLTARRILRPSALIVLILAVIFVVTAYAGSWPGDQSPPTGSTPGRPLATAAGRGGAPAVIGQCLVEQPEPGAPAGQVVVVPCTAPNKGQILAEVTSPWDCPTGTYGWPWRQHTTILCATAATRPASP